MTDIATLISTVGFPIAAFVLMFWFCKDTLRTMQDSITKSLEEMRKSIDNNTTASTRLITYMETRDRSDIDGE